jgi:hypothetical protein
MKISINLSEAETKGIKAYLQEVDSNSKPTKEDIRACVEGELQALFQSQHSALADYINQYR